MYAKQMIMTNGARAMLDLISRANSGANIADLEIDRVLDHFSGLEGHYSQWFDDYRLTIHRVIASLTTSRELPTTGFESWIARGFVHAAQNEKQVLQSIDQIENVSLCRVTNQVADKLPAGTPLRPTVIVTLDALNAAFVFGGVIAISALHFTDEDAFINSLAHELHHIGFGHWSRTDAQRQALLDLRDCSSIATRQVQNLLMEGCAGYYFTPLDPLADQAPATVPQVTVKRIRYLREHLADCVSQTDHLLTLCLWGATETDECEREYRALNIDPNGIFPIAHYVGERLIGQIHEQFGLEAVTDSIRNLSVFLPTCQAAAPEHSVIRFSRQNVNAFQALWS